MIQQAKIILRMILMVAISAFLGLAILCGIYALPADGRIFQNAQESARTFEKEGEPFSWGYGNITGMLDNITDSVMIQKAIFPGTGNILEDTLQNPGHGYLKNNPVEALLRELHNETDGQIVQNYGRYWHGYLLYLKPLLWWGTIGQIRVLNGMVQLLLAFYLFIFIGEKMGRKVQWAFLLTYLSLNPISLAMSFQYSSMYYIMMLTSLWILRREDQLWKNSEYIYAFTVIGIMTAFFDFLTYPLVSYGIPVVIFLLLLDKKELLQEKWSGVMLTIKCGLAWAFGYGGMYLSKWLLLWWFVGYRAFQEAVGQVAYRMSDSVSASEAVWGPAGTCSFDLIVSLNVLAIMQNPVCWGWMCVMFLGIGYIFYIGRNRTKTKEKLALRNALGLIALSPFVWYAVLLNHSFLHFWFTFRELSIFIFAMSCYVIVKWQEYERK